MGGTGQGMEWDGKGKGKGMEEWREREDATAAKLQFLAPPLCI